MAELPPGAIWLDPAVAAAKRTLKRLQDGALLAKDLHNDIVVMIVLILRLAGHEVADQTGEGL